VAFSAIHFGATLAAMVGRRITKPQNSKKFQIPKNRTQQTRNFQLEPNFRRGPGWAKGYWSLGLGISLGFGFWGLVI
jgi:hypothetical protein